MEDAIEISTPKYFNITHVIKREGFNKIKLKSQNWCIFKKNENLKILGAYGFVLLESLSRITEDFPLKTDTPLLKNWDRL